jgi:hypothetical protein
MDAEFKNLVTIVMRLDNRIKKLEQEIDAMKTSPMKSKHTNEYEDYIDDTLRSRRPKNKR